MKGAVQGEAMATASTPVRKASPVGLRACRLATRLGSTEPNSNRPARLRPMTVNSVASAATTQGLCSWKPQPMASPAERRPSSRPPRATKDSTTPAV
mgnify:CR=1 FL=1